MLQGAAEQSKSTMETSIVHKNPPHLRPTPGTSQHRDAVHPHDHVQEPPADTCMRYPIWRTIATDRRSAYTKTAMRAAANKALGSQAACSSVPAPVYVASAGVVIAGAV